MPAALLVASLSLSMPQAPVAPAADSELRAFIDHYDADRAALRRRWVAPLSQRGVQRLRRLVAERETALRAAAADFAGMSRDGQVDWLLMRTLLRRDAADLDLGEERDRAVRALLPLVDRLVPLVEERMDAAGARLQPRAEAGLLHAVAGEVAQADGRLRDDPPDAVTARRAAGRLGGLRRELGDWFEFRHGYDPQFTWWVEQPWRRLDRALADLERWLRREVVGEHGGAAPLVGDPIGAAALRRALDLEWIPYSPAELVAIAEREFAWCDEQMARAGAALGFDDWRRAQDHVKAQHVDPGQQPQLIRTLALEAEAFLAEHQLVTVPPLCSETWRMAMMSPERQAVNPYFTGGEVITVSFPTADMAHDHKLTSLRGNNVHFARATVHHELIPGHHLQQFMTRRHRPYRRPFATPFWLEGWALYWEMRLWDLGFARGPEDRVGMLFWRKHRCARIVFSLRFHLGEWTAEQCVDYLVDRVGHERRNAEGEVRRSILGDYPPLYQAAYMLGGLQLRALHRELVVGGGMTERAFHDAVLTHNSIPIELLRMALGAGEPTADAETAWRFADER